MMSLFVEQFGEHNLETMVTNEEHHCVLCQSKLIELTQYLELGSESILAIVAHPSYLLVSKANTGIVGSSDLKSLGVVEGNLKEISQYHIFIGWLDRHLEGRDLVCLALQENNQGS